VSTLVLQLLVLTGCVAVVYLFWRNFPYPSPLIKKFLPPNQRWPVGQITEWVESGNPERGFLKFFLRDPERTIPPCDNVVAPTDGTVLDIIHRDGRIFLVISLNVWDVHVARAPLSGMISRLEQCGDTVASFVNEANPAKRARVADLTMRDEPLYFLRDKRVPVQKIITLETGVGEVKLRLITSYLSRRIELFLDVNDRVSKGQRIGRMLFGSTAVLEFDRTFEFSVEVGQRVIGGETVVIPEDLLQGNIPVGHDTR
jgi:phosphatidylserine decarboxylase